MSPRGTKGRAGQGRGGPSSPPAPTHADVDAGRGHITAVVEVILDGAPRVALLRRRHGHRPPPLTQQRPPPPRCRAPSASMAPSAERLDGGAQPFPPAAPKWRPRGAPSGRSGEPPSLGFYAGGLRDHRRVGFAVRSPSLCRPFARPGLPRWRLPMA